MFFTLRSRRLEVVGTRKNGHATSKRLLRRLRVFYQVTLATYYQVTKADVTLVTLVGLSLITM